MLPVTISAKGWVVIPAQYRRKYNLQPGSQVQLVDYGGVLAIVPLPSDPIEDSAGMLSGGPSLTADLLAERARERERERG